MMASPADWGAEPIKEGPEAWGAQPVAPATPKESSWSDYLPRAITDMHKEGAQSFSDTLHGVTENLNPSENDPSKVGVLESQLNTGKGLLSAAGLPFAYPMGAARSLIGHPLASGIEAAGN